MVAVSALCGVLVAGLLLPVAGLVGITTRNVAEGFQDLPLELRQTPIPQRTTVLDSNGKPLAYFYSENRQDVLLSEMSRVMRRAVIAIEDSRFYEHGALDVKGTLRALVNNAANGATQGGSSITQQLVKMTLIEQADTEQERQEAVEQSFARKWRELQYAMAYEQTYSKNEILRNYLNIAYFGDGAYGIQAAAQHYFSVDAADLDVRQSALLAGLVKNPTQYDPTDYPKVATERRNVVLARMAELGMIRDRLATKLAKQGLGLDETRVSNGCVSTAAPFFCDYVRRYLMEEDFLGDTRDERQHNLLTAGLTIKTTLDRRMQRATDTSVRNHVNPTDNAIGGMALVVPGTGEVRALSQSRPMGRNKNQGETYLNYTVPVKYGDGRGFQGGSTFKAFVLATALKKGYSPRETKINAPQRMVMPEGSYRSCDGSSPEDWPVESSTSSGFMDMYRGTQESVNTFYAQLEKLAGLCASVNMARSMGIDVPSGEGGEERSDEVGPFTLGVTSTNPLDMAAAYATFPARGVYCTPSPVTEVLDNDGEPIVTLEPDCKRVLKKNVADAVNDILRGVQEPGGFGYDRGANLEIPSAAKTGTINKSMTVWFMGYTPDLVASAMVAGANQEGHWVTLDGQTVGGTYISSASGSSVASPMWKGAMGVIQKWLSGRDFVKPDLSKFAAPNGTVPTVAGLTVEGAGEMLREAGYVPQVQSSVTSTYAAGTVAYTSPAGGTKLPRGSTVYVYPSIGSGTPATPAPTTPATPAASPVPRSPAPAPDGGGGGGGHPGNGNPGAGVGPGGNGPPGQR